MADTASGLQREFHAVADSKRFINRIRNPFLTSKERAIARMSLERMERPGGRLLEIACGEGSNYDFLKDSDSSIRYVGIDFSGRKVSFMKGFFKDVDAAVADGLSLPFRDSTFDLVLCRDYLHHVDFAREQALKEALRVAKPGASILIFESNGAKMMNRVFRLLIKAERGARNSTLGRMDLLLSRFGAYERIPVEASFAVRAVGFFAGWGDGFLRKSASLPLYYAASVWEAFAGAVLPERLYFYHLYVLRKS